MPRSRRSASVGVVPLIAAFSNFLAPGGDVPHALHGRRRRSRRRRRGARGTAGRACPSPGCAAASRPVRGACSAPPWRSAPAGTCRCRTRARLWRGRTARGRPAPSRPPRWSPPRRRWRGRPGRPAAGCPGPRTGPATASRSGRRYVIMMRETRTPHSSKEAHTSAHERRRSRAGVDPPGRTSGVQQGTHGYAW